MEYENFFHQDNFHHSLCDLLDALDIHEEEDAMALPDDWSVDLMTTKLEPIQEIDFDDIVLAIMNRYENSDRSPDDMDYLDEGEIKKAVLDNIDFVKLNAALPHLYYPADGGFTITKADILEYMKPSTEALAQQ